MKNKIYKRSISAVAMAMVFGLASHASAITIIGNYITAGQTFPGIGGTASAPGTNVAGGGRYFLRAFDARTCTRPNES